VRISTIVTTSFYARFTSPLCVKHSANMKHCLEIMGNACLRRSRQQDLRMEIHHFHLFPQDHSASLCHARQVPKYDTYAATYSSIAIYMCVFLWPLTIDRHALPSSPRFCFTHVLYIYSSIAGNFDCTFDVSWTFNSFLASSDLS